MVELVKYIATNLVDKPEAVVVTSRQGDHATIIELSVAPEDMGKVIGKQGRTAKAIRTVVKAASVKETTKYIVEILEENERGAQNVETDTDDDEAGEQA